MLARLGKQHLFVDRIHASRTSSLERPYFRSLTISNQHGLSHHYGHYTVHYGQCRSPCVQVQQRRIPNDHGEAAMLKLDVYVPVMGTWRSPSDPVGILRPAIMPRQRACDIPSCDVLSARWHK